MSTQPEFNPHFLQQKPQRRSSQQPKQNPRQQPPLPQQPVLQPQIPIQQPILHPQPHQQQLQPQGNPWQQKQHRQPPQPQKPVLLQPQQPVLQPQKPVLLQPQQPVLQPQQPVSQPHILTQQPILHPQPQHPQHGSQIHHPGLKIPQPRRTKPIAWFVAIFCAVFWILIILGGLAILIVYLVFRPQSPRFDIQNAGLNAAYLDTGILLNADITILANFTNPNKKVAVDFSYIEIQLYYGKTLIAINSIRPFSETRAESKLVDIHMISSEVRIPVNDIQRLRRQIQANSVPFIVKGRFRTKSKLRNFLGYTYFLHGQCTIVLTGPPSGVLVARRCSTKR
ncbi:proline-rich receptor-like kinase [Thalictrum thalictroides]|uniref:Proline-rich receptor-like kinase n=1 Tax=Thalictrum thalictroides TaxID=46969 RepID=A0A7J6WZI4_THATH|nr:proline-rich receptor-like kinase [Thalictrum thalictroides]